jgi:hypothetical protein
VDRDDGVARVVVAGEERVLLQARELARERLRALERLVELAVLGDESGELHEVGRLAREGVVAPEPPGKARLLRRDLRRPLLIVPEAGLAHRLLELGEPSSQRIGVKGNHGPSRAGP